MRLPPDFAILGKLSEEEFMVEAEMAMTKLRWEKQKLLDEDTGEPVVLIDEEREIKEEEEAKSQSIFDRINRIIDMRNRRVTDMKENSRIHLPKPLPANEEAKIEIRRDHYEKVFQKYFQEKCSEKGNQSSNMTQSQLRDLTKLKKRVAEGEIIILMTDKTGRFSIADIESYIEMGRVHTDKDTEVGDEEVKRIQRLFNGHTAMWLKFSNMGERWRHEQRCRESCLQQSDVVPPMYLLHKNHKPRKPASLPATCPWLVVTPVLVLHSPTLSVTLLKTRLTTFRSSSFYQG